MKGKHMEIIDGQWYMNGIDSSDPNCITSSDELLKVIEKVGFLPLFEAEVPGMSVESMTDPKFWWTGDAETDPWEWRGILARTGKVAYGKFFGKKAGFVSKKWFPYFANYRRNGYDFDSRYEDGKAERREKLIMDLFWPRDIEMCDLDLRKIGKFVENPELFSFEVKDRAGFGTGGEKNFEGTCAKLQMGSYLLVKDFKPRLNKKGEEYGWSIAVYTLPEYLWGYRFVTERYSEDPRESLDKIISQIKKHYDVEESTIRKLIR